MVHSNIEYFVDMIQIQKSCFILKRFKFYYNTLINNKHRRNLSAVVKERFDSIK